MGRAEVKLHEFLTLTLDGKGWLSAYLGRFVSRETSSGRHWLRLFPYRRWSNEGGKIILPLHGNEPRTLSHKASSFFSIQNVLHTPV
jgi:hypothetical protein